MLQRTETSPPHLHSDDSTQTGENDGRSITSQLCHDSEPEVPPCIVGQPPVSHGTNPRYFPGTSPTSTSSLSAEKLFPRAQRSTSVLLKSEMPPIRSCGSVLRGSVQCAVLCPHRTGKTCDDLQSHVLSNSARSQKRFSKYIQTHSHHAFRSAILWHGKLVNLLKGKLQHASPPKFHERAPVELSSASMTRGRGTPTLLGCSLQCSC